MAVISGGDFQIRVRTSTGPDVYTVVADMHTFNDDERRNQSEYPVFDKSTPHRKVGKRTSTLTVDGYDNPVDAGQAFLNAASLAGTTVKLEVTRDGSVGYTVDALVSGRRYDASAEEETLQGRGYDFIETSDRTEIS
jgi:hypothetical protein